MQTPIQGRKLKVDGLSDSVKGLSLFCICLGSEPRSLLLFPTHFLLIFRTVIKLRRWEPFQEDSSVIFLVKAPSYLCNEF